MLERNQVLQNRYRIVRQLGSGGMGAVYEAIDERFGQPIALKEIIVEVASSHQQSLIFKAFEREAKSLAIARHEVVPFVRDYFSEAGSQFLVMELVDGEDLGEGLKQRKSPFPVKDLLNWMEQLLDALDYLHTLQPPIIHRDIKPQNLKINSRNKIKLLDFGIARSSDKTATMTAHTFVGATLNYSPVEQILRVTDENFRDYIVQKHQLLAERILKQDTDGRCDIYALGATFYHLMTNQMPIDALKRLLSMWAGKGDPLVNPMELNPEIPPIVSFCIMKAMEVDRKNRYASAIEMQADFKKAQAAFNQPKPIQQQNFHDNSLITQVDYAQRRATDRELTQPPVVEPQPTQPVNVNQPQITQKSEEAIPNPVQPITQPAKVISNTSPVEITASQSSAFKLESGNNYQPEGQTITNLVSKIYNEPVKENWFNNKAIIGIAAICLTAIVSAGVLFTFNRITENVPTTQNAVVPNKLMDTPIDLSGNEPVYLKFGVENDFINSAASCFEKKNYQCVVDNLSNLLKSAPKNAVALNNRGVAYFLKGNYSQAVSDYSQAIKINSQNAVFFHNRALAYSRVNDKAKAKSDEEQVTALGK